MSTKPAEEHINDELSAAAESNGGQSDDAESNTTAGNARQDAVEGRYVMKQTEKSKSFNDRHIAKQYANSAGASPPELNGRSKPRRREASSKSDAEFDSLSPPSARDSIPRRPGTLPKYDFTFRCVERAEKRREFFSKLEEKIRAKEAEKSTLEAKAKEKEEEEIKMLRKSLIFKANPMPSFYQEPPPPKPLIKKIPTTKPKSPKFARRRTPATSDSDDHSCCSARSGRPSLDSKMIKNKSSRGSSPVAENSPVRKSLPKPPPEKTVQEKSPDNIQEKPNLSSQTSNETVSVMADKEKESSESAAEPMASAADRN